MSNDNDSVYTANEVVELIETYINCYGDYMFSMNSGTT